VKGYNVNFSLVFLKWNLHSYVDKQFLGESFCQLVTHLCSYFTNKLSENVKINSQYLADSLICMHFLLLLILVWMSTSCHSDVLALFIFCCLDYKTVFSFSKDILARWVFPIVPDGSIADVNSCRYSYGRHNIYLHKTVTLARWEMSECLTGFGWCTVWRQCCSQHFRPMRCDISVQDYWNMPILLLNTFEGQKKSCMSLLCDLILLPKNIHASGNVTPLVMYQIFLYVIVC